MPSFPRLKTDAVAQYPATRVRWFANQIVGFLDGTEQRFRDSEAPLLQWVIRLAMLDEQELAALDFFFVEMQGAFGSFSFVDPWDGSEYANCSLDQDALEIALAGEMRGRAVLIIRENRS